MAGFMAAAKSAALTVNGTSGGNVVVASSVGFFLNQRVWLSSATVAGIECLVVDMATGGVIGLRAVSSHGYGKTDVSAYLVANSAILNAESQFIAGKVQPDPLDLLSSDGTTLTINGSLVITGSESGGGDVASVGPVGATPNANAASIAVSVLTLQPASSGFPGVVTIGAQTLAGAKSFSNGILTNTIGVTSASSISVYGAPTDAANAIGTLIGSSTTLANTAAKLVSIKNNSTEKASFDLQGRLTGPDLLVPLMTGGHTIAPLALPVNAAFSTATTGGTLVPATYWYRVAATNAQGTTLASTQTSQVVPAGTNTNTVTVNWALIVGATGYKVYGRTTGAELLMATISSGSTLTFVDDGSVTPAGALPTAATTGGLVITDTANSDRTVVSIPSRGYLSLSGDAIGTGFTTGGHQIGSDGNNDFVYYYGNQKRLNVVSGTGVVNSLLGFSTPATYTSSAADGANAIGFSVSGARLHLGAGTTDYLYSDGVGVATAGYLYSGGDVYIAASTTYLHNNAGSLQLKTATGYVYADLGTQTSAAAALGGGVDKQFTAVGNVGAGEDTLMTYTLPANSLTTATLRTLRHEASGTTANNANAKTLKFYFGSQMLSAALTTSIAADWIAEAKILHTAANAQRYVVRVTEVNQATGAVKEFVAQGTLTEATTATIVMKLTGTATADNDIVQNTGIISVL